MKNRWNIWGYRALAALFLTGFIVGGGNAARELWRYWQADSAYDGLEVYLSSEEETRERPEPAAGEEEADAAAPETEEYAEEVQELTPPQVDFAALAGKNQDITGWIWGAGTKISYPVVYRREDNTYYLNHMFDGRRNGSGCIFLDGWNEPDLSDRNTCIYGHHMKNGTMFAALSKYRERGWYEAHPELWYLTETGRYRLEVFAAYVADVNAGAWQKDFSSEEEFDAWVKERQRRSAFTADVLPGEGDRVITLSTCSYEFDDARFVVHAVLRQE
ncbi:MAG: class B sortase [Eubacteriales bacterium]|nr:class B sortase [Eubacteriales bacterium]